MLHKYFFTFLVASLLLGTGCEVPTQTLMPENASSSSLGMDTVSSYTQEVSTKEVNSDHSNKNKVEISRKDELELEGFINDYFYRRQIKDQADFSDFDAYGSVVLNSIVIYIYPKNNFDINQSNYLRNLIKTDIQNELLSFEDFKWAKDYSFDIVIR